MFAHMSLEQLERSESTHEYNADSEFTLGG